MQASLALRPVWYHFIRCCLFWELSGFEILNNICIAGQVMSGLKVPTVHYRSIHQYLDLNLESLFGSIELQVTAMKDLREITIDSLCIDTKHYTLALVAEVTKRI